MKFRCVKCNHKDEITIREQLKLYAGQSVECKACLHQSTLNLKKELISMLGFLLLLSAIYFLLFDGGDVVISVVLFALSFFISIYSTFFQCWVAKGEGGSCH